MEIVKLNNENFKEEVIPILDDIANELGSKIKVCKVNVDESRDIAMKYEIMSIPTLIIFKNGKIVNTLVGLRDKNEIIQNL